MRKLYECLSGRSSGQEIKRMSNSKTQEERLDYLVDAFKEDVEPTDL